MLFIVLISGITIGYFLRKNKIEKFLNFSTNISIFLLHFFIGVSVGSNEIIIRNLGKIGFDAFILTIAAVIGTVLISFIVYKMYFQKKESSNER